MDPYYTEAFNNRGFVWTVLENYEKAKKDLYKALQLNPKNINALFNLGNAHANLGKEYHLALKNYEQVLAFKSQS